MSRSAGPTISSPEDVTPHFADARDPLLVLLCTYNEIENLPSLIPAIVEHAPQAHLLVVDDGSPDGTGRWLDQHRSQYPMSVIHRAGKLGLGTAIRCGLRWGMENGFTWVLNMDADWSHQPSQLGRLCNARNVDDRWADLVIGSRYVAEGGLVGCSWRRKLVSRSVNILSRTLLGIPITDFSSAFRCYRTDFLQKLSLDQLRCEGYGFLEELLFHVHRQGGVLREVPITYEERRLGQSKISVREAYGAAATLIRLFGMRFRGS